MAFLYTLGYSGMHTPADLAAVVEGHDIDLLIDIRFERPLDGYFGSELVADTVKRAGIDEYRWEPRLGNPDYRIPGSRFPNPKPATRYADPRRLPEILELITTHRAALMCTCPHRQKCHRRILVDDLLGILPDLTVQDLT